MAGILPLREEIAAKVYALYGAQVCPENEVTVTSGATEAIFDAIQATVGAGDEVILFDPAYDCYDPAIRARWRHASALAAFLARLQYRFRGACPRHHPAYAHGNDQLAP